MTTNKILTWFVLTLAVLTCLSLSVSAQKKKPRAAAPKPVATLAADKAELKAGAEKVSIQIKNATRFLYILGGVAKGIESIDKDIKAGKASRDIADQNTKFKQSVIQSIRNLRAGLVSLEVDFRTKTPLKPYLLQLQGISDISGTAEDLALGGQFDESGKTLLNVVEKLADTLAAMP